MQNVKCKIKGYRCVRTIQRRGAHCASAKGICPKNGRPAACGMSPLRACALPKIWGLAGSCLPCRAGACSRRNNRKAFVSGGTKAPPYGFSCRRTATQHPDKSKFETLAAGRRGRRPLPGLKEAVLFYQPTDKSKFISCFPVSHTILYPSVLQTKRFSRHSKMQLVNLPKKVLSDLFKTMIVHSKS